MTKYCVYPALVKVEVGELPHGPVVEKSTAKPEVIVMALVMPVEPDSAVVAGVMYVLETSPTNVKPVPNVPAVWA